MMGLRNIFERFGTLIFVVLAIFAVFFIAKCTNCTKVQDNAMLDNTILQLQNDSLTYYKNQNGEQIAKITALQGYVAGFLEANFEKDKTLQALQKTVSEHKKRLVTATALLEEANAQITFAAVDICDTTFLQSTDTLFLMSDEWGEVSVTPSKKSDSLEVDIQLRNEIHIWHQYGAKPGLFKPPRLEVFALQKSPYFKTEEIKSIVVPPPQKRKRWIIPAGVVATIVAIIAAKK